MSAESSDVERFVIEVRRERRGSAAYTMNYPQAYHITWGTYGARLPGSAKPHVTTDQNIYKAPLPKTDPKREQSARDKMHQSPVRLTLPQRKQVIVTIEDVAKRYAWTIHAVAPQSDHVHVVITAPRVGQELRDALKAVCTRELNKRFVVQKWWSGGGSCKYLFEDEYFANAMRYVKAQLEIRRCTRRSRDALFE